jgi:hypothetical protein
MKYKTQNRSQKILIPVVNFKVPNAAERSRRGRDCPAGSGAGARLDPRRLA